MPLLLPLFLHFQALELRMGRLTDPVASLAALQDFQTAANLTSQLSHPPILPLLLYSGTGDTHGAAD